MLRLSDSRNFSRTLAAIGLLAGPVLFLAAALVDPAWDENNAQYLQEVAADQGRYALSGALWTLGALFFVAGALGLIRLMRGRRVGLGQIGAGLLLFGSILSTAGLGFNAIEVEMADASNREAMVALTNSLEDSAALNVFWSVSFFGGIVLGSLLLGIALLRRRIVPIWSPILLFLAIVAGFAGGESQLGSALSFIPLVAALFPLSMKMLSISDDDWERWELPLETGEPAPAAAAPPPTQPAAT